MDQTIANALRIAADQYDSDAAVSRPTSPRLVEQFERQAREARELADRIESEGLVMIVKRGFPAADWKE